MVCVPNVAMTQHQATHMADVRLDTRVSCIWCHVLVRRVSPNPLQTATIGHYRYTMHINLLHLLLPSMTIW